MTGGNIDAIAGLVFRDVPMINRTDLLLDNIIRIRSIIQNGYTLNNIEWSDVSLPTENKKTNLLINDEWIPYIQFNEPAQFHTQYNVTISFKADIDPNTVNERGQTLLFLAAQNCNKQMIDALVAMGVRLTDINRDGSTILHGTAWGKVYEQGQSIKTYDEKIAFIQEILGRYRIETIPLLFRVNQRGETCYDNLLMRHPDKISKSLEDVAFPIGWVKRSDTNGIIYYENTSTGSTQWDRLY